MLEESISCSPGNDKDRSRSRRFHKATKRRSRRQSGATQNSVEVPCLDALYEDTDESILLDHFNPFENERILAVADAVRTSQSKIKFDDCLSQGFVRLEQLPVIEGVREDVSPKRREECSPQESWNTVPPVIQPILGPETQFGISNSEFVRFCDEVEIDELPATQVKPKSVVDTIREEFCESPRVECPAMTEVTARRDPKSIVDAILEDFCGSPYSESPPRFMPEDATPVFRFKSNTLRTYSGIRPRKSRRNIAAEMAEHVDDGHVSDSSSGLSVQEDLSQNAAPELDTVNLNNSIKVCENLLNLSSYFTQTTSHANSPPLSGSTSLSVIIDEIIKLKGRTRTITRSRSIEEFLGFSDQENESTEDTLKELLEDEDDVLQQINCDSLCYETVVPKKSLTYDCSELECTLQEANAVIEEANRLIMSIEGSHAAREESARQSLVDCDKHEDLPQSAVETPPHSDKQLLDDDDDIDLWNDNDCLLSYKTQKFYSSPGEPAKKVRCLSPGVEVCHDSRRGRPLISNESIQFVTPPPSSLFVGFSTASKKPIAISDEAKRKADEILSKFEREESEQKVEEPVNVEHPSSVNLPGSTTASLKQAVDSEEVRQRTDQVLSKKCGLGLAESQVVGGQPPPSLLGFTTASRKPVVISETAKRRADEILAKFEKQEAERKQEEDHSASTKSEQSQKSLFDVKLSSAAAPISVGFSTASRKPIAISEKAKKKADAMLKQFEEEEREKTTTSADVPSSDFPSFSTASKKPIVISDEAKRRADNMMKKFEQEEREKREIVGQRQNEVSEEVKRKAEELLVDIEFFEEAFEEELKGASEEKNFPPIKGPSETAAVPIFEGFKTASRKSIEISEAAKKHAEKLVQNVISDDLPQEFIKCIESDLEACSKSVDKMEQVDGAAEEHIQRVNVHKSPVKSLPQLVEPAEIIENLPFERNSLSQSVLHSSSSKRKRDSEGTPNANAPEPTRRLSFNERTPLNRIENGILHKTTSLSAIMRKSASISRKNLLSLSKRKKCNDAPAAPKTPEKAQLSSECNANETPNLKQFFDSVSTSTPRLIRTGTNQDHAHDPKESSIESDFRPINWDDGNESGRVGLRTSLAGDPNIMSSQISPSPKQRIQRLKMYGEPPPISPILMANKCRPSGLRKARSFVKP